MPKKWADLNPTVNQAVRFCQECQLFVFLCKDAEELEFHAKRLHCIAYKDQPKNPDELDWEIMGQYSPPEYNGPTMSILLNPTYDLRQSQLDFISKVFDLNASDFKLRSLLCDGKSHQLGHNLNPDMAESLSKRLANHNIDHQITVNPELVNE